MAAKTVPEHSSGTVSCFLGEICYNEENRISKEMENSMITKEAVLRLAGECAPRLREIWADLHSHPELGFEEVRTAGTVAACLRELGIETEENVCGTGVVGTIRGGLPGGTILLRADMDALSVTEATGLACASLAPGKTHACGHDAHTTWLLGAAMILSELREQLHGTVKLMFQPGEEVFGGAQGMIEAGILEDPEVDMALGAHVTPRFDAGVYHIQSGTITANPDFFTLRLYGRGAHGSEPQSAVDAINMGVKVYELLQTFVSRLSSPSQEVVLSVCTFHSGTSRGAIPGECELVGTVRSFRQEVREQAKQFIEDCAKAVTGLYGGRYEYEYEMVCPSVENDEELTRRVQALTAELLGPQAVVTQAERFMGGEDFCLISRRVPSVYLFVGCRNDARFPAVSLHNPAFRLDESVLARTAAVLAYNALRLLEP